MAELGWKIGVEIELLAPPGRSRRDLAEAIARRHAGAVRPFFHPQAEPGKVPGKPIFENLTQGFEALDARGNTVACFVDDLTLQDDLDKQRPPRSGWYRIVSDDARLLRLVMRQAAASDPLARVLDPVAALFGSKTTVNAQGMVRLADETGAPIAIAAPLPGERERPCELVTPPLASDHLAYLHGLLEIAQTLGFTIPAEGALHIHFDAGRLCSAPVLANLVNLLWVHGAALRRLVGANPRCRRLGRWPEKLHEWVNEPGFAQLPWEAAKIRLQALKLSKYCDFNLKNMIHFVPAKHTFEVRIFPVWLRAQAIVEAAVLFEAILFWALQGDSRPVPPDLDRLLLELPLLEARRRAWRTRLCDETAVPA